MPVLCERPVLYPMHKVPVFGASLYLCCSLQQTLDAPVDCISPSHRRVVPSAYTSLVGLEVWGFKGNGSNHTKWISLEATYSPGPVLHPHSRMPSPYFASC